MPDGKEWTKRWTGFFGPHGVVWTGTQLVAAGWSDSVLTSPDGITWTSRPGATRGIRYYHLAASDKLIVAVGERGNIMTSPDGIEWTLRPQNFPVNILGMTWTGESLLAVGPAHYTCSSKDGAVWSRDTLIAPPRLQGLERRHRHPRRLRGRG